MLSESASLFYIQMEIRCLVGYGLEPVHNSSRMNRL
jgi:hypothetical protein